MVHFVYIMAAKVNILLTAVVLFMLFEATFCATTPDAAAPTAAPPVTTQQVAVTATPSPVQENTGCSVLGNQNSCLFLKFNYKH